MAELSRWDVIIESAAVSATNFGGGAWDGDGDLPDVYVRLVATEPSSGENLSADTDAVEDLSPDYDAVLLTGLSGRGLDGMLFELLDSDGNADDSIGACRAAPRMEDLDSGTIELECPRSANEGNLVTPPRAGWTLHYRLEPRSAARPGAASLDLHEAPPLTTAPGTCTVSQSTSVSPQALVSTHDSQGRLVRQVETDAEGAIDVQEFECSDDDRCELTTGVTPRVRRYEPGPFGSRVRIRAGGFIVRADATADYPHDTVRDHDSLGRLVAERTYDDLGELTSRVIRRYTARRWEQLAADGSLADSITYDDRGRPIERRISTATLAIEVDERGLPAVLRVTETTGPLPIGATFTSDHDGPGCVDLAAAELTNGRVLPP